MIELQLLKAPRPKIQRIQLELKQAIKVPVLHLEVLGG
jgi:hypothetical protein